MKTKNIPNLLLLLAAILFIGCEEHGNNEPPYHGPPKGNIISVERARELYATYNSRRVPIIQKYEDSIAQDSAEFTPTRYAEFDLKTIKQYIAYIEHEAKEADVEVQTLRFYLSNYPNSDKFPNGDVVKYPRRNSFFVVPTMENQGENVGFSIQETDGKYTAVPLNRMANGKERKENNRQGDSTGQMNEAGFFISSTTVQGGEKSLILDEAQVCPPPGTNDFGNN